MTGMFQIPVQEVRKGDKWRVNANPNENGWDAISDAVLVNDVVRIKAQHVPSGDVGWITFDHKAIVKVLR